MAQVQYDSITPSNVNNTIYIISITLLGTTYSQNIQFIPDVPFLSPPPPPPNVSLASRPYTTDNYYNVFSYTSFLIMINNALSAAFIAAGSPGGGQAPYFIFNVNTGLISLIVSQVFIASGATIEINDALLPFLDNFQYSYITEITARFVFFQLGNICNQYGAEIGILGGQFLIYTQQAYCLQLWNSLRKIFFTTFSIPINNENRTGNINNSDIPNPITVMSPTIFDITPKFNIINSERTLLTYSDSQYKLVDLLRNEVLYRIQISVFCKIILVIIILFS